MAKSSKNTNRKKAVADRKLPGKGTKLPKTYGNEKDKAGNRVRKVEEPVVFYTKTIKPEKTSSQVFSNHEIDIKFNDSIVRWLNADLIPMAPILSDFDIIRAGSAGIARASADKLSEHLGITRKTMAEDILDMSVKTMERKAPKDKLDKKASTHVLEIARLMQHAFEVFEDENKVRRWINTENRALNGMRPLQLFDTLTGLNMVTDVLTRIEEGVYS